MADSESYIGVSDQELELATSAKDAFDNHKSVYLMIKVVLFLKGSITIPLGTRVACQS